MPIIECEEICIVTEECSTRQGVKGCTVTLQIESLKERIIRNLMGKTY